MYAPLAQLGLGRAYAEQGDREKSGKAYNDFFTTWKDAEPNIPILRQAKAEYKKLTANMSATASSRQGKSNSPVFLRYTPPMESLERAERDFVRAQEDSSTASDLRSLVLTKRGCNAFNLLFYFRFATEVQELGFAPKQRPMFKGN